MSPLDSEFEVETGPGDGAAYFDMMTFQQIIACPFQRYSNASLEPARGIQHHITNTVNTSATENLLEFFCR